MKSVMTKKSYYFFTHPELPGYSIENHGERTMELNYGRCTEYINVEFSGDKKWDIIEENIHKGAEAVFIRKLRELKEESEAKVKKEENGDIWVEFEKVMDGFGKLMDKAFKKK